MATNGATNGVNGHTNGTTNGVNGAGKAKPFRIGIIGAGIGGLVLAQLLHADPKFSVTVYERGTKQEPNSTLTGFRILVSKEMLAGLRTQLPPAVVSAMERSVGIQPEGGQHIALLDQMGRVQIGMTPKDFREASSVSRWKLRHALLEGLDDVIHWETEFERYEQLPDGSVRAFIASGQTVEFDVLVGADGAGSPVRKQLLPDSTRDSLGITVLYFKVPLTPETELMMPYGTGSLIMSPRSSMILSYYKDKAKPYGSFDLEKIDADDSYLLVGVGCYTEDYLAKGKQPDDMTPDELKAFWLERTKSWHPLLRSIIGMTVPSSVYTNNVKTQHKYKPWQSKNVVLLGDAAHSMTPYLGKGATSAIADSLSLADHLQKLAGPEDKARIAAALDCYTKKMLKDGFGLQKKSKRVHDMVFMGSTPMKAKARNALLKALGVFMGE